ncbi:hypothetical protein [Dinghuibacter silviterrae]|uniref:Uncharacterized protein n=1 Tax=Dinghuibacter silviterrae TaxID=1539049 RepID=A0A4R8DFV7_9BACT|nr:hypothetical protein [Dinghuibacter silviterrae]TDW95830.1 hypothetical protein EDB95_3644 [Dinghuibacter silviterrae]
MNYRFLTAVLVVAWIAIISGLAVNGFFADFTKLPPRLPFALLIPLPVVLAVAYSKRGTQWLRSLPPQWLIYIQTMRILVEIGLWLAVSFALLPVQMSFEGRNFDVLTGLMAIPVGYFVFVKRTWPRGIALVFNIGGLLLLTNALALGVLSMPLPIRMFHNAPDSGLLARFPYIFLPGVLVPLAYTGHIFSLRQWGLKV